MRNGSMLRLEAGRVLVTSCIAALRAMLEQGRPLRRSDAGCRTTCRRSRTVAWYVRSLLLLSNSVLDGDAPLSVQPDASGFIPLFDGKTLDGWTVRCLPKELEVCE